jgi:uncharacterized membrane protein YfcA
MDIFEVEHLPESVEKNIPHQGRDWLFVAIITLMMTAMMTLVFLSHGSDSGQSIILFVVVGFLAQIIDGSLGMAYGVSSTTFLLSTGVSPAAASASVHTAEVFTTLVSGLSHLRLGNVDKSVFKKLLIPGVIGGVLGAYTLSTLPGNTIKPFISFYLMLMGIRILWKALKKTPAAHNLAHLFPLALLGGLFDAIGGGGWGPIVTTTLVARGNNPRLTIGSVNLAEFFVTLAEVFTFLLTIKLTEYGTVILGLVIGGGLAAPMAAYVCRKVPARGLMTIVGCLIIGLSIRTVVLAI